MKSLLRNIINEKKQGGCFFFYFFWWDTRTSTEKSLILFRREVDEQFLTDLQLNMS